MVDPRVHPPKAEVELADIVRRFGPQYASQYGHRMMPSQKKAFGHRRLLHARARGDGSTAATTAIRRSGTTTAAGTGHAPNAMATRPGSGSKSVKPSCCRAPIFTPS